MIYIFGDSWGFSYRQTEPQPLDRDCQVFHGADLSSLMMESLDERVTNLCERGMSLFSIGAKILKFAPMFNQGDTVIVLQTDPLRSCFLPWYNGPDRPVEDFKIPESASLLDVCDNYILSPFYSKLKTIEHVFKVQVILHGGISGINSKLADSLDLMHTELSSTEIIIPEFADSYFFDVNYIKSNHAFLSATYENYIKDQDLSQIVQKVMDKNQLWANNPELFTHNHTTELGTRHVAKYLSEFVTGIAK